MNDLFLPEGYRENPPVSTDADDRPYWDVQPTALQISRQEPVYRTAGKLAIRYQPRSIVDVGCGTGHKLVRHLGGTAPRVVGVDQASAIDVARRIGPDREWLEGDIELAGALWDQLASIGPELAVCVDVIEHVVAPLALLERLHEMLHPTGRLVLSTPDRHQFEREGAPPLGPPRNERHIREWAEPELVRLVTSNGFRLVEVRHLLPRRYFLAPWELRRLAGRLRRGLAIPDRRSCMVLLLEPTR